MKYLVKFISRSCISEEEIEADRVKTDHSNNLLFYEEGEDEPIGGYHKDRWIRWKRE